MPDSTASLLGPAPLNADTLDHNRPSLPGRDITIWIDVEDLFDYARHNPRPSGIQRLAFLLQGELHSFGRPGVEVRFVRHASDDGAFVEVAWDQVQTLFGTLVQTEPGTDTRPPPDAAITVQNAKPQEPVHRPAPRRRFYHPLLRRLPRHVREPLAHTIYFQRQSAEAFGRFLTACNRAATSRTRRALQPPSDPPQAAPSTHPAAKPAGKPSWPGTEPEIRVRPGDWLLILGSPWFAMDYARLLRTAVTQRGGRVAVLIYDLIPLRRPEWCDRNLVQLFARWFSTTVPLTSVVFAISHATADDLRAYAHRHALPIPDRVVVIPVGSGFPPEPSAAPDQAPPLRPLPAPGTYVMFVSTLEARKNHTLLFRIWRRMLDELPEDQVPTLVFAGRVGWLVADLMQQLRNTDFLGGKIVLLENVSDAELAALYHGCMLTLFPSFYEGWGLPVTESLSFGKPCIAANNSSLPEAGGTLARYFDADDIAGAQRVIAGVLADRAALSAWERQVAANFRPVPWRAAARVILDELAPIPAAPAAPLGVGADAA